MVYSPNNWAHWVGLAWAHSFYTPFYSARLSWQQAGRIELLGCFAWTRWLIWGMAWCGCNCCCQCFHLCATSDGRCSGLYYYFSTQLFSLMFIRVWVFICSQFLSSFQAACIYLAFVLYDIFYFCPHSVHCSGFCCGLFYYSNCSALQRRVPPGTARPSCVVGLYSSAQQILPKCSVYFLSKFV